MDELDWDEGVFLVFAAITGGVLLVRYYFRLLSRRGRRGQGMSRLILALTPAAILLFLTFVLENWADAKEVRGHEIYIVLFLAGGASWLGFTTFVLPFLGLSVSDDAVERGNAAAGIAIAGAIAGVGLVYSLCNVGAGPTIWTTLWPAVVASVAWIILYLLVNAIGGTIEAITIERDPATGIRFAAFLLTSGILLGRSMAGDWHGWDETYRDFLIEAWPAAILAIVAGTVDRALRPSPQSPRQPTVRFGLIPAIIYLLATAAMLVALGPWHANEGIS